MRIHNRENEQRFTPGRFIAIIGAGFSGSLLAIQLLRRSGPNDRIYLFEKEMHAGPGLAYATENPKHLLNVCASNMSAFPDEPDHFLRWLQTHGPALGFARVRPDDFVPRWVFGRYVEDLLHNALSSATQAGRLFLVQEEVTDIEESSKALGIDTADGKRFHVDIAIVATGNTTPRIESANGVEMDPWSPAALKGLSPGDDVLLIGTGLTMVDVAMSLIGDGHKGTIHAVSRHGLIPSAHPTSVLSPLKTSAPSAGLSPLGLLRWLRAEARAAERRGGNWRHAVNSLRPHSQSIWAGWTIEERRRFLRHCRSWWDVHRHRMAPDIARGIDRAIADGALRISAGRVGKIERRGPSFNVDVAERGRARTHRLSVARVIDCTGLKTDYTASPNGLLRALIGGGLARPDVLQLGLDVDERCALINGAGRASNRLFAVGPLTRGAFWEIVAIPDIRVQCAELAARVLPVDRAAREWPIQPVYRH